ncbi:glycosyltransferase family 2 protein [Flavobacterium haoranii]|uniref:Glycosyltransferase, GT2 family n=1 Tax=Flavobacterium haoranii TaxID=683124 RepID=A0A1M6HAP6_9FLAO|nr:glycosyltransferase family 2 protein [Flavobacterium haoranii]SHJ19312.1 Glycosyltransferase, GT2 family [Flavobacterium haoranii]
MNKIAIVILNWNGAELLHQFLPTIIQYSTNATIYVADNASTDNSIEVLQTEFPEVKIISNTNNFGFAKGYNEALQYVEEPLLALVNSDIEVTEGWLNPILDQFNNEANTAIIQPKILDYKNKALFEYAGAAGGFIDKYGFPFCRGRIFESIEKDTYQYNDIKDIFWASGACFFIRNEVFKKLQGFDEDFFAHQEEIDLCWRVKNLGYQIKYNGNSTVYHVGGATLKTGSPYKTFLNFRNSLWMLTKNLPKKELISTLFIRLTFDGIAGIKFLLEGKPLHLWAVLKSHFYFYLNLNKNLKKRNPKTGLKKYYTVESIVYLHYIKKKKYFSELF